MKPGLHVHVPWAVQTPPEVQGVEQDVDCMEESVRLLEDGIAEAASCERSGMESHRMRPDESEANVFADMIRDAAEKGLEELGDNSAKVDCPE